MCKSVSYCRVSTSDQAEKGVSLDAQKEKIKQYASLYNYDIIEEICDAGFSGKDINRDGIQKILLLMRENSISAVIVSKLDRLTRSVKDLIEIVDLANKNNIAIVSVSEHIDTSSAAGRMMLNLLTVISQWERETISERTKTSLQYKKQNGRVYNGVALYGFKSDNGFLVPDNNEQSAIEYIMREYKSGKKVASICRGLRGRGIKTRNGNEVWSSPVVKKIISDTAIRIQILTQVN